MRRSLRRTSAALEQLLEHDVADGTALSRVLTAARGPGSPDEVAGLDAAKWAFAAARHDARPAAAGHRRAAAGGYARRWFALKAVAAVSGVTLVGGVAYAASDSGFLLGPSKHGPSSAPTHTTSSTNPYGGAPANGALTATSVLGSHTRSTPGTSHPVHPVHPLHPLHPAHPSHPVHPTHPTHPPSPTHPASTTHTAPAHGRTSHPAHPSHPAKPSSTRTKP